LLFEVRYFAVLLRDRLSIVGELPMVLSLKLADDFSLKYFQFSGTVMTEARSKASTRRGLTVATCLNNAPHPPRLFGRLMTM